MRKSKRGVSEMVAYVLLIIIAISLSVLVYAWLKNAVWKQPKECSEDVSLTISDYACNTTNKEIILTLQNNGLFNINGFLLRISNTTNSSKVYDLTNNNTGKREFYFQYGNQRFLKPNEQSSQSIYYTKYNNITRIEIQPFVGDKSLILCEKSSLQIENCG